MRWLRRATILVATVVLEWLRRATILVATIVREWPRRATILVTIEAKRELYIIFSKLYEVWYSFEHDA